MGFNLGFKGLMHHVYPLQMFTVLLFHVSVPYAPSTGDLVRHLLKTRYCHTARNRHHL